MSFPRHCPITAKIDDIKDPRYAWIELSKKAINEIVMYIQKHSNTSAVNFWTGEDFLMIAILDNLAAGEVEKTYNIMCIEYNDFKHWGISINKRFNIVIPIAAWNASTRQKNQEYLVGAAPTMICVVVDDSASTQHVFMNMLNTRQTTNMVQYLEYTSYDNLCKVFLPRHFPTSDYPAVAEWCETGWAENIDYLVSIEIQHVNINLLILHPFVGVSNTHEFVTIRLAEKYMYMGADIEDAPNHNIQIGYIGVEPHKFTRNYHIKVRSIELSPYCDTIRKISLKKGRLYIGVDGTKNRLCMMTHYPSTEDSNAKNPTPTLFNYTELDIILNNTPPPKATMLGSVRRGMVAKGVVA